MRYAIGYDISNNRVRARVVRLLKEHGQRVQKSVFEGFLDAGELDELWQRLRKTLKSEDDAVVFYPLCEACEKKIRRMGRMGSAERPKYEII